MSHSDDKKQPETLNVDAARFGRSPFLKKYITEDCRFGVYAGRFTPLSDGKDPAEEYWALRRQAVLYDVPERPVAIEGPDAPALLEKIFTRSLTSLKVGRARYAIACLPHGGILMDGLVLRLSEDRFWYVKADGEFDSWLSAHAHGLDVRVFDPRSWVLQVQGPRSLDVMSAATDGSLTKDLGYFALGFFDIGGQELLVSRTGWTGELGYEIYTQGTATDCPALWDHLLRTGTIADLVVGVSGSMNIRRIEAGILNNTTDMDHSMTPFAAGLGPFVDLEKSDFIGRETLREADRRPRLFGYACPEPVSGRRLRFFHGDRPVGRPTALAWSPFLRRAIGYVRFDEPGDWLGETLSLRGSDGKAQAAEITALPFYDPEKRIPRDFEHPIPAKRQ